MPKARRPGWQGDDDEAVPTVRRRSGLTGRAAILVLVLAALVVSYASSLRAWADQRARIEELRAEVADREDRVAELERELTRWKDPAFVEAQARERFGWVMPGEIGYVVVGEHRDVEPTEDVGGSAESRRPTPPWWRTLWGSVEAAGNPPKPKTPKEKRPKPAETITPIEPDE